MSPLQWQAAAEQEIRRRKKLRALEAAGKTVPTAASFQGDFLGFAQQLYILPKSGKRELYRPTKIQRKFEAARTGRDIVLKPRQIGLTTHELARDVWKFICFPGSRVVIIVQSLSGDKPIKETSARIELMFLGVRELGIPLHFGKESVNEWTLPSTDSTLSITGSGASEAAASKKGRSGTITRLHLTEPAFYEYPEQTTNAVLECVPGEEYGTEVTFESTANGATGDFFTRYHLAKSGASPYTAHFYSWLEQDEYRTELEPGEVIAPRNEREQKLVRLGASPEQLKWYRQKVADKNNKQDLVDQEYPPDDVTCWIVSGSLFFDRERTIALQKDARDPVIREGGEYDNERELRIFELPKPGVDYVIVCDPSEGVGADPAAAGVFDATTGKHVATLRGQWPTYVLAGKLAKLGVRYNDALIVVERNNHGHAVLQGLVVGVPDVAETPYDNVFVSPNDERPGWLSTSVSRAAALDALDGSHRASEWSTPDKLVLGEMLTFVTLNGKPQAQSGAHDDLVLMSAIAHDVLSRSLPDRYERGSVMQTSRR